VFIRHPSAHRGPGPRVLPIASAFAGPLPLPTTSVPSANIPPRWQRLPRALPSKHVRQHSLETVRLRIVFFCESADQRVPLRREGKVQPNRQRLCRRRKSPWRWSARELSMVLRRRVPALSFQSDRPHPLSLRAASRIVPSSCRAYAVSSFVVDSN
jgi:hypothetical protein